MGEKTDLMDAALEQLDLERPEYAMVYAVLAAAGALRQLAEAVRSA